MNPNTGEYLAEADLEALRERDPEKAAEFSVKLEGAEADVAKISELVKAGNRRRSISEAVTDAVGAEDIAKASSPTTKMALALAATNRRVYEGTVPPAVIAHRRAKNKAARAARRGRR